MRLKNKYLFLFAFLVTQVAWSQVEKVIPSPSSPPRLYNDFTKGGQFLTGAQASSIEKMLTAFDDSTSNQIAIVIVETLEGYTANEFATALGRKWGVGSKQFNNGIVLLISTGAKSGDRDAYIATGYGLEGAIPDVVADAIVENELIPSFKQGNYYKGLAQAITAIQRAAAGEYHTARKREVEVSPGLTILLLIILLLLFAKGKSGGGGMINRRGHQGWTGGGWYGGGWSGGGFGGSSGGGFGGFGGGGFGGGGAGGKW